MCNLWPVYRGVNWIGKVNHRERVNEEDEAQRREQSPDKEKELKKSKWST